MPASQIEVASYGAKLLKMSQPNPVTLEEVESEMLKNLQGFKKVDNKKMKSFFNYNLKYPTYKGLNYIFSNNF